MPSALPKTAKRVSWTTPVAGFSSTTVRRTPWAKDIG